MYPDGNYLSRQDKSLLTNNFLDLPVGPFVATDSLSMAQHRTNSLFSSQSALSLSQDMPCSSPEDQLSQSAPHSSSMWNAGDNSLLQVRQLFFALVGLACLILPTVFKCFIEVSLEIAAIATDVTYCMRMSINIMCCTTRGQFNHVLNFYFAFLCCYLCRHVQACRTLLASTDRRWTPHLRRPGIQSR